MRTKKQHRGTKQVPGKPLLRYNSLLVQVSLIRLICFCYPNMFNVLSGISGCSQVDATAANNANTGSTLRSPFSTCSGIVSTTFFSSTHPLLQLPHLRTLLWIFSLLQPPQGSDLRHFRRSIARSGRRASIGRLRGNGHCLPGAGSKGTHISLVWSIFNMGRVVGGLIPFIFNYNRSKALSVNDATYISFMCFMTFVSMHKIIRVKLSNKLIVIFGFQYEVHSIGPSSFELN